MKEQDACWNFMRFLTSLSQISLITLIFFCSSSAGLLASRAADLADWTVEG